MEVLFPYPRGFSQQAFELLPVLLVEASYFSEWILQGLINAASLGKAFDIRNVAYISSHLRSDELLVCVASVQLSLDDGTDLVVNYPQLPASLPSA